MKLLAFCEKHVNVESLTNAFINNFITYTFFYICGLNKQVLTVDDAMLMITLKDQGLSKLSSLDNHCGVLVNLFWPVTKRDRFWPVENEINQYIFFFWQAIIHPELLPFATAPLLHIYPETLTHSQWKISLFKGTRNIHMMEDWADHKTQNRTTIPSLPLYSI